MGCSIFYTSWSREGAYGIVSDAALINEFSNLIVSFAFEESLANFLVSGYFASNALFIS
jgi:hypothetical protein